MDQLLICQSFYKYSLTLLWEIKIFLCTRKLIVLECTFPCHLALYYHFYQHSFCDLLSDAPRHGGPRSPRTHIVVDHDHSDADVGWVRSRSTPSRRLRRGHDERPPSPPLALGRRPKRAPASPPSPPSSSRGGGSCCGGRGGRHDRRRRRCRAPTSRHRYRSTRAGGVCRAVQAAPHQAGRDASGRRQGAGQPQAAGRRRTVPEYHMPVWVADAVTQQHDRAQADPAGVAGGGGGTGQEQAPRSRRAKRAAGRREEAEAHVDRGARETIVGSVLRRAAAAVGGEDRGHSGKARPEEERGQSVVLQPEAEAKAHEVCGPTLMTGSQAAAAIRRHTSIPSYKTRAHFSRIDRK